MKTILTVVLFAGLLCSCSGSSCECNLYTTSINPGTGDLEQTLADVKKGPCTAENSKGYDAEQIGDCN